MISEAAVTSSSIITKEVVLDGATVASVTSRRIQQAITVKIPQGLFHDERGQTLAFVKQVIANIVDKTTSCDLTAISQEITIAGRGAVITGNIQHESIGQLLHLEITPNEDLRAELEKLNQAQQVLFNNIAELIAQIRDHDTQLKQHTIDSSHAIDIANYCEQSFIPALERTYAHFDTIERLFAGTPIPVDEAFINVAVVSFEEQREKERALRKKEEKEKEEQDTEKEKAQAALKARYRAGEGDLGLHETIYLPKKEIALGNIFSVEKNTQLVNQHSSSFAKRILVEGRAGVGKSTLAKFFAYQWSKRQEISAHPMIQKVRHALASTFSGVVWIALRRFNQFSSHPIVSIEEFLLTQRGFEIDLRDEDQRTILKKIIDFYALVKKPLLYLLDGWDELQPGILDIIGVGKVLETLLKQPAWLVTSRPGQVPREVLNQKEAHLELLGFSDDNVQAYVKRFFSQATPPQQPKIEDPQKEETFSPMHSAPAFSSQADTLLEFIAQTPMIAGMAHIPINLELLCCVWKEKSERLILEKEFSLSELYYEIIACLIKRYHDGEASKHAGTDQIHRSFLGEQLWPRYHHSIACLQAIAFEAITMKKKSLLFCLNESSYKNILRRYQPSSSDENIIASYNQAIFKFEGLKPLQDTYPETIETDSLKQQYYFVHLSFQEFFAACHLFNQFCSEEESQQTMAFEWLAENKYFLRYRDVMGFLVNLLYLSNDRADQQYCDILGLHAMPQGMMLKNRLTHAKERFWAAVLEKHVDLIGIRQMELLIFLANHMGKAAEAMPAYIALKTFISEIFIHAKSSSFVWFSRLKQALGYCHFGTCERLLSEQIQNLLSDDEDVQYQAIKILVLDAAVATPQILLRVGDLLQRKKMIRQILIFIEHIGATAATDEILSGLSKLLPSKEEMEYRYGEAYPVLVALQSMGAAAATSEILAQLYNLAQIMEILIISPVLDVLNKMGKVAITSEVLSIVEDSLQSEDKHIQRNALIILKALDIEVIKPQILASVESLVQSEDEEVLLSTLIVLKKMGDAVVTPKIVLRLINLLQSKNDAVENIAFNILNEMHAPTSEILLLILTSLLESKDNRARRRILRILGEIQIYKVPPEVLSILEDSLQSEDENIQLIVLEALGVMGIIAATPQILYRLENLVKSENKEVWVKVPQVLKKMSSAIPSDIISRLEDSLESEDKKIQLYALNILWALGAAAVTSRIFSRLENLLQREDEDMQLNVLSILKAIGVSAAAHLPILLMLEKLVQSDNEKVLLHVLPALEAMGVTVATPPILCRLESLVQDRNKKVRIQVLYVLREMSAVISPQMLLTLIDLIQSESDRDVQWSALRILTKIDTVVITPPILLGLENLLQSKYTHVQDGAFEILKKMGAAATTLPILIILGNLMQSQNKTMQRNAFRNLQEIGAVAVTVHPPILSILENLLPSKDEDVQLQALYVLKKFGVAAITSEICQMLGDLLQSANWDTQKVVLEVLQGMGPAALTLKILFGLERLVQNDRKEVQQVVIDALNRMDGIIYLLKNYSVELCPTLMRLSCLTNRALLCEHDKKIRLLFIDSEEHIEFDILDFFVLSYMAMLSPAAESLSEPEGALLNKARQLRHDPYGIARAPASLFSRQDAQSNKTHVSSENKCCVIERNHVI